MPLKTLKPRVQTLSARRVSQATPRTRGRAWMETRSRIMRRANGLCECQECQSTGRLWLAHEVDHIVELADGGSDEDSNLMAMNRACHADKTADGKRRRGQTGA